jgi:hypothetical protein
MAINQNESASYTNLANIKDYWLKVIAPQYLDLDDKNNYNIGIFGYINEIMGNTAEDTFNAITVARREFYPVTAKFASSLYTMAALQSIDIPLTTPASCKCALIIPQNEIIQYSTFDNGLYECTIDSCLKIFAGELQFMLDYPIKIISKKTGDNWVHIIHYDINITNSLNTNTEARYISNIILKEDGINYVVLFIDTIRQLEMTEISKIVVKDSILDTISLDMDFSGNLANFEVFYKESPNSQEMQLSRIMINAARPSSPYVQYELVNPNKIRLIFEYNSVFNPKYNSEIICRVYTSKGSAGNFNSFSGDLVCSSDSALYGYNANMTILGKVNGSSTGGADRQNTEEFRNKIHKAYSTNHTITTSHDLQLQFDDISDDISNVKVLFKKKRDDPLIRLFGAFTLLKDKDESIIPTNTLTMEFLRSDFVENLSDSTNRISIPPGTVFEYKAPDSYVLVPAKNPDQSLKNILEIVDSGSSHYFITPFMLGININPNNVGYYISSIEKYMGIVYTYVNDNSLQQFIGASLQIYRNAVYGSNYYKISIKLIPASTIDPATLITVNDPSVVENQIRADYNGIVTNEEYYYDSGTDTGYVRYTIKYDSVPGGVSDTLYIQASNTLPINNSSVTGYIMKFKVGERFVQNDILAVKRPDDLGNLLICGDISGLLRANEEYIALSIQDYDSAADAYVLEGYLATEDEIDLAESIVFTHGIYTINGEEDNSVPIPMKDISLELNVLYHNDISNISHKYSAYAGLELFTLTNTYMNTDNDKFSFIEGCKFIRSVCDFLPGGTDPGDYKITISESPVIGAKWASSIANYDYFIAKYNAINTYLNTAYYNLENNFNIDSKFYNTYGKSRFYRVGNNTDAMQQLNSVKCSFRFGVKLNTLTSTEHFIINFRNFVREYIESAENITTQGQDVYVMNMISEIRTEFPEISYIEYYGMNSYNYMAQKIVGPGLDEYRDEFTPEFLNMNMLVDPNGDLYPDVAISLL